MPAVNVEVLLCFVECLVSKFCSSSMKYIYSMLQWVVGQLANVCHMKDLNMSRQALL